MLTAEEAVSSGFANGIVTGFDRNSEWFEPSMIPIIPKLLKNDYGTLTNAMEQINLSKNNDQIDAVTRREGKALVACW